ncbi:CDP-diacylglycerol--serine O-phosphatidyltransferase [Dichelobacter nodosus]|uniref:CDP-diacylglycerol--serine O-phosphatidyltransferase n=1 Tax=Dichelobacter nodosus (strain VCS1703A) TaxID=246195 RepID=A5EVH7_DICNV|nr:CDP-diacylglycerol--serine O-phosphatidyltransferase [Dichelobacter nodosus]ABQ14149.1 CDP-diacylglycerol--serine O- phosphatidyltransferase [Dichelobacter nodosus VCS1703A]AXM45442.1 CDP-diacylglycerol--serine O-phosphatidyltransferase [Dichelobacter nodosus]TGA66637.1 CDP-diacylglycerol--serine O-phosphatidyltransferase [Dichelobacter nodosus]
MQEHKLAYLLPNSFTTASLFCGFYSILAATNGNFRKAAVLIFAAMIFDGCDGRVARLTKTESEFGIQYDSLSDLVSFGVAPAMVMYQWSLHLMAEISMVPTRLGWMTAFIYTACTALRLGRFNVQVGSIDKAYFIGLPSPSAAAVIAGYVWVGSSYGWQPKQFALISGMLLLFCGLAMVSNIRYFSGKSINWEAMKPFHISVLPALVLGLIWLEPAIVLFTIFLLYGLHGPVLLLWRMYQQRHHG